MESFIGLSDRKTNLLDHRFMLTTKSSLTLNTSLTINIKLITGKSDEFASNLCVS